MYAEKKNGEAENTVTEAVIHLLLGQSLKYVGIK